MTKQRKKPTRGKDGLARVLDHLGVSGSKGDIGERLNNATKAAPPSLERQRWLEAGVEALRERFAEAGYRVPEKVRVSVGWPLIENPTPCGTGVTTTIMSPPCPGPLYLPRSGDGSPANWPDARGGGSTAAAMASVVSVIASGSLFVSTTTASCASGYHRASAEKPKPPPLWPRYLRP